MRAEYVGRPDEGLHLHLELKERVVGGEESAEETHELVEEVLFHLSGVGGEGKQGVDGDHDGETGGEVAAG